MEMVFYEGKKWLYNAIFIFFIYGVCVNNLFTFFGLLCLISLEY